ncbi:MAG: 16S rRNA (guanine(527)-N(7))-methyltransferase RsmG [Solirubrobacteraceae bacterium]
MVDGAGACDRFELPLGVIGSRYGLDPIAVRRLSILAWLLTHDERAPTSVREPALVRDDHLADALVALELPAVRAASRLVDIGAGAGVPGLPLAAARPDATVALVEASGRKCEFMIRAAELMGLENVEIVHSRAESWQAGIGQLELVTARALGPLDVVAEYAAPLLRLGGALVAWRGRRDPSEEREASRAAAILGLEAHEPVAVKPYRGAEHRHLVLMTKVAETPQRFPRRAGVARKRPLGRT